MAIRLGSDFHLIKIPSPNVDINKGEPIIDHLSFIGQPNTKETRDNINNYINFLRESMTQAPVPETQTKTYEVSREHLKKIHDVACSEWKRKIADMAKTIDPFKYTLQLEHGHVEAMFEASNEEQIKVLESIFPEYESDDNAWRKAIPQHSIELLKDKLKDVSRIAFGKPHAIQVRSQGPVKNKSFYVPDDYIVVGSVLACGGTEITLLNRTR